MKQVETTLEQPKQKVDKSLQTVIVRNSSLVALDWKSRMNKSKLSLYLSSGRTHADMRTIEGLAGRRWFQQRTTVCAYHS